MKRIFRHLLPFWPQVLGAAVLMTVSAISQLLLPTLMSGVVNEGVYEKDFTVILGYCGQMLAVALVGAVAVILGRKLSAAAVVSARICEGQYLARLWAWVISPLEKWIPEPW